MQPHDDTPRSLPPMFSQLLSQFILSGGSLPNLWNADRKPSFDASEQAVTEANTLNQGLSTIVLYGQTLVYLTVNGQKRLCLTQVSRLLLSKYSYNEIHNRRVALGITCVQCSPAQTDLFRRSGAMPPDSRRCGTITVREAERLVKSFVERISPPRLPPNFVFNVRHRCGWGCQGQFIPSRYNSSRAKCIRCGFCQVSAGLLLPGQGFFSPNKFIFHCHRPEETGSGQTPADYRHPDAANFNAWRRHLHLVDRRPSEELVHAWEDVKVNVSLGSKPNTVAVKIGLYKLCGFILQAMFNGGNRKRKLTDEEQKPDGLITEEDEMGSRNMANASSISSEGQESDEEEPESKKMSFNTMYLAQKPPFPLFMPNPNCWNSIVALNRLLATKLDSAQDVQHNKSSSKLSLSVERFMN
ncbi:SKI transcriptional corepressor [Cichlidogyrus casuarinus]|uniref:SKI transcriptional corepressor n=1 Tax=Cichlidogyrus casuarinus TaxID=1844966 RepID=A0ABD2Q8J7_9PLAT